MQGEGGSRSWQGDLSRQVWRSLPGLAVWVVVCAILFTLFHAIFNGWSVFTSPKSWGLRALSSLVAWIVVSLDAHKPRWRIVPSILVPIGVLGLSAFLLAAVDAALLPLSAGLFLAALLVAWVLVRRWRAYRAADLAVAAHPLPQ